METISGLTQLVQSEKADSFEKGMHAERERIVRLLRDSAHEFSISGCVAVRGMADLIERGH